MEKISKDIVTKFFKKSEEGDERDVLIFGVQRFLEDVTKITLIIIVSIFLHVFKELMITFLYMMLYKNFVGGAHARTNLQCLIFTSLFSFLPIYFTKLVPMSNIALIIYTIFILLISAYVIIKIAPADTTEIPIQNKKQRLKLKIGAVISLLVLILLGILIKNPIYFQIGMTAIFFANICTTKSVYRLFKCKYGYEEEL